MKEGLIRASSHEEWKNLAQMYKTTCELIQILIEMSVQTSGHNPLIKSSHFASTDCFSFESV